MDRMSDETGVTDTAGMSAVTEKNGVTNATDQTE